MNTFVDLNLLESEYGAYVDYSRDCWFWHCNMYSNVYGLRPPNSKRVYLRGCELRNNSQRGLWSSSGGNVDMGNCLVMGNGVRGAFCDGGGRGTFRNCNFISNGTFGVQANSGSGFILENCIIAYHDYGAYEVPSGAGGSLNLINCAFYSNLVSEFYDAVAGSLNTADDINNNAVPVESTMNNIVGDPLFLNLHTWDMRLNASSPCIDAGTADTVLKFDFYGRSRLVGPAVDIGIYEMPASGMFFMGY